MHSFDMRLRFFFVWTTTTLVFEVRLGTPAVNRSFRDLNIFCVVCEMELFYRNV